MTLLEESEFIREDEHKRVFFGIASLGMSCGLMFPHQWLDHFLHTISMVHPFVDVPAQERKAIAAMAFFYRNTGCMPEEEQEWEKLTDIEVVNKFISHGEAYEKYMLGIKEKNEQT